MIALGLLAASSSMAAEATAPAPAPKREKLTISQAEMVKPWTGDLDGMVQRRFIRILTVYSKTFYTADRGVQRGAAYDAGRLFVDDLNKKLAAEKRLKNKNLKVIAVFIPMHRGELLPALAAGKGDIAMSSIGVTAEGEKLVDYTTPVITNVSALVVTGPSSPAISGVDDLAGKEVYVRRSSAYYQALQALNQRFAAEKKPAVIIKEMPEALEDEDLIEMVNAGLIPLTVSADTIAKFWKQVFPKVTVHEEAAVATGGNIAWAIRKGSPQLKAAADDFVVRHAKGTQVGNQVLAKYFKSARHVRRNAPSSSR